MAKPSLLSTCVAVIILLAPVAVAAQTTTGVIGGVVRGPDGDVLPGVMVVANSPSLIQKDLAVYSDGQGYYRLPLLIPGIYEVSFSLQGFQPLEKTDLIVRVGQTTEMNAELVLAAVEETTVVVGEAPIIDARAAKLAFTYTEELIENIPTARTIDDLFATVPGVESANNFGVFQPGVIEVQNVLGAGERTNSYSLDGANITDPAAGWNSQSFMPYDTIEEVQVVKAAKPAEIPFQGGFFNTVTKSGGNDLSGQVGAYFADDALQASNVDNSGGEDGAGSTNELVSGYELTASLGGRVVPDKLWWYGAARRREGTSRVFGFDAEIDNTITSLSGKLTYQPARNHRITGTFTSWDQDVSHYFFGFSPAQAVDEKAAAVRPVSGNTFSGRWSGILSDNLLAEAGVSYNKQGFDQLMQPGTTEVAIVDLVTGQRSRNLGDGTRVQRDKNISVTGSMAWFVPDARGRHDVKFGFEYLPTTASIEFDDMQDHRLHSSRGRLFAVRFLSTPSTPVWNNDLTSLYAQDSWTIADRLTLNFGLRFMHTVARTPETRVSGGTFAGTSVADRFPELNAATLPATELINWSTVEPRFALTYALDRVGRTVVRAGASRYYHNLVSFDLFVSNPAFPHNFVTLWFDRNGDKVFQVGEDGPLLFSFGGQINPVDPDIERPYTDEFLVGMSHEINGDVQVSGNFIYRTDSKLMNTVDIGVPFDTYTPVDVLDPGPDGVEGTGDDASITVFAQDPSTIGQSQNLLTNPPGNDRTYKGVELTASKRFSNNWQAVASVVISEQEVIKPTPSSLGSAAGLFDSPNGLINAKGLDPVNQTVQLKLQGTYMFRFGLTASAFYRFLTGNPYTRDLVVQGLPQSPFTVRAEPRGSSTTDNSSVLDLRFEQRFTAGRGSQIGVMVDIFNVFNAATVVDYGRITGVDYGEPRSIRNPRVARLGVRYIW